MRIISFCAMLFSSKCFVACCTGLDDLRREFSVRLTVRIIPAHEKYRHRAGTRPWRVDLRSVRISQPPDYRTYSPEVTSLRSNLPVHRSVSRQEQPYHADLIIISDILSDVKVFFSVFHNFFQKISDALRCTRKRGKITPSARPPLLFPPR